MIAGLRRLLVLFVVAGLGVGAVSAVLGLVFGSSFERAVSLGYYVVGAFALVLGFFAGARGPLRPRTSDDSDAVTGLFGVGLTMRGARKATRAERQDSTATAALFIATGTWLIALGILVDSSVDIF